MIALLQRVTYANVIVADKIIGEIKAGLLVFIGIEKNDATKQADRLIERILGYRIFADEQDRMNLNVKDIKGGLLLVPQFTLAADTKKSMRPSFTPAADPKLGNELFQYLNKKAKTQHNPVATGQFGANMQINLCNNGPVTFLLKA
jgi:D-aminoacyl-tRNA deacylase